MTTIGQSLTAPESGWKRFDDTDNSITYEGAWVNQNLASHYNSTMKYTNSIGAKIKFNFTGTSLRLITNNYTNNATDTKINIDGEILDIINTKTSSGEIFQCLSYEKTNLKDGEHYVIIENVSASYFRFDAIDISDDGNIFPFSLDIYKKRLILKNQLTNQHYSLAEKTLIVLPNISNENIILHGIELGKEIKLDEDFNKIRTVNSDGTFTEESITPFSVYDYISENPQVIIYTESTEDITVSTTTEPYTTYDEFGDEIEVLYYTDDNSVNTADLILEANYSPLDELEGNFEVVTWTDDSEYAPVLGIRGDHIPLTIYPSELIGIQGKFEKLMIYEDPESKDAKYLLTNNNSDWYKWDGIKFIEVDINNIAFDGMTIDEINNADYNKWNKDRIGVSIYMSKDSVVSGLSYIINDNVNSPKVSNLHLYILNTTAKIDLELKGSTLSGQLSDDDLSKVQYRVILNGGYYYPNTGNFTALSDSPNNINLTFSSRDIKIDDWNDLTVEFKDSFGSVDYWNVQFIGKYNGLVFRTTDGQYYSTDLGEILSYLDFGMIIAGQSTLEHQVVLKNQYGETVKDANLSVIQNTLPKGVSVEFANDGVENWNKELLVSDKLESDEEVVFKVRMNTEVTAEPISNGTFEIFVNALKEE